MAACDRSFYFDYFGERAGNVKEFIEKEERLPMSSSNDKYEKSLGTWLDNQMKKIENGDEDIKERLSHLLGRSIENHLSPLFQRNQPHTVVMHTFDEMIGSIKEFIKKEKRMPSSISNNNEEKMLGEWVNTQKQKIDDCNNKINSLVDCLHEVEMVQFIQREGRFPSSTSNNKEEKALAMQKR